MSTLLKRALLGLAIGLVVGSLVAAIGQAAQADAAQLQGGELLAVIVLVGGMAGAPIGAIVGLTSDAVDYRSGWGWEWALLAALGAALSLLLIGRLQTSAALVLLISAACTGAIVERAAARLFGDLPYGSRATGHELALYLVAVVLIVVCYVMLFSGLLLGVEG